MTIVSLHLQKLTSIVTKKAATTRPSRSSTLTQVHYQYLTRLDCRDTMVLRIFPNDISGLKCTLFCTLVIRKRHKTQFFELVSHALSHGVLRYHRSLPVKPLSDVIDQKSLI